MNSRLDRWSVPLFAAAALAGVVPVSVLRAADKPTPTADQAKFFTGRVLPLLNELCSTSFG